MSASTDAADLGQMDEWVIASHAWKCLTVFERGETILPGEILGPKRSKVASLDFKSDFQQFRVWAKNLGVFAQDTASVDYRLRGVWDVRKSICSLLDALCASVSRCIELITTAKETPHPADVAAIAEFSSQGSSDDDDDDDEISAASQLHYLLGNTSDLVEKLLKISVAIRKYSLKAQNLRADAWEDEDEDGLDETDLFEQSFRLILEKRYGLTDPLKSRICVAICTQKHRIKYWRAHQKNLSFGKDFQLSLRERQLHVIPRPSLSTSRPYTEIKEHVKNAQSRATHLTQHTEATKYTKIEFELLSITASKPIPTISFDSHALKATIPKPPFLNSGMKYFECPFCCLLLLREKADSVTKWRSHVISDLCPFVCVDTSCSATTVQFEKESEWFEHHKKCHAKEWWCDGLDAPHEPQLFHDAELFVNHIRTSHTSEYSETQVQTLLQMSETSGEDPFQACPFCDATAPSIESHLHQRKGPAQEWCGHIANHLIDLFVTFALPQQDDLDDEISDRATNSHRRETLDELDGSEYDISTGFSTPKMADIELEDKNMEDAVDVEYQWDFIPKMQLAGPDLVLNAFLAGHEQAHVDQELQHCLSRWLGVSDPSTDYHAALQKRDRKTGLWLLNGLRFKDWETSTSSLMWLYGFAGCGKTVLSAAVIQHLIRLEKPQTATAVSYFFFDCHDVERQSSRKAVRSLLFQFAQQAHDGLLVLNNVYQECGNGKQQPTEDMVQSLLRDIMDRISSKYIILDALDECTDSEDLLTFVRGLAESKQQGVQIITTSRNVKDIEDKLSPIADHTIDIQNTDLNEAIYIYVRHWLNTDPELKKWPRSVQNQIRFVMTEKAGGMAQCVDSQLELIRQCVELGDIQEILSNTPRALDETYGRILQDLESTRHLRNVVTVLRWLCFSQRTLRLLEVADILAIENGDERGFLPEKGLLDPADIMLICSDLVTCKAIDGDVVVADDCNGKLADSNWILLLHPSLKEYLLSDRCTLRSDFQTQACHREIAESCLWYLLDLTKKVPLTKKAPLTKEVLDQHPLAEYTAVYWFRHVHAIDGMCGDAVLDLVLRLLANEEGALLAWLKLCDRQSDQNLGFLVYSGMARSLYYAASLGLSEVVQTILAQKRNVNAEGGYYCNALQAASYHGHEKIVQMLLAAGADVNAQGGRYGNVLQAASDNGHEKIVQILLAAGADVNAQGGYYGSALQAASDNGHEKIVQMLLAAGADVNAQGGYYGSALQAASHNGHEKIVQILLAVEADVNAQGGRYGDVLQAASDNGHEKIVQMLLAAGADVNAQGGVYGNSLRAASYHGHEKIVQILLAAGAAVRPEGGYDTAWKPHLREVIRR